MRRILLVLLALTFLVATAHATSHPRFDSRQETGEFLTLGDTYERTFAQAGTYNYHTTPWEHGADADRARAVIVVKADAANSGTYDVMIKDKGFNPNVAEVKPGTKVVWTNHDDLDHTVTEDRDSPGPAAAPTTTEPVATKDSPAVGWIIAVASLTLVARRRK